MASYTLEIPKNSLKHGRLKDRLQARLALAKRGHQTRYDKWRKAEETTLAYLPESEADLKRKNKREVDGIPSYTTLQIPYSYATLMSAHTYWTSVFFARNPIHQYSGLHGETEMQTQALEALISYQMEIGGAMGPYYIWLYDAGKYGCGILGHYWEKEKIHYGQIVEMQGMDGTSSYVQATRELQGYQGNKVYNLSPYDFMHDPRVPLTRFQEGEFVCARRRLSWTHILQRRDQGYFNSNIDLLKEHVGADKGATDGSSRLERPNFQLELFENTRTDEAAKHPSGGVFWEIYVNLVPREWGVGDTNYPQKWCFTITEDEGLIVGASPLGLMHGKFPFDVLEPEIEGYAIYNRGFPEIIEPVQNTMDWLLNTHFFNVRAALNNQFIVDPSKLVIKDAKQAGPGFIWRLRPEAYGTDISKMFYQVPVRDVTQSHMHDIQSLVGIGERTLGVNDQIMGMLNTGGRKTATEVRTTTGFGVNRLKTITEYMSATGMAPHSLKLVQSSQQNYDAPMKLRIAGDLSMLAGSSFLNVRPEDIAGGFAFMPVDGTLPVDRMAQANLWKELLGSMRMLPPQTLMGWDFNKILGWVFSLAGLKNVNQFKVQVMPDEQLAMQAQQGNVIPLRPGAPAGALPSPVQPGNSASTAAGLNSLMPQ